MKKKNMIRSALSLLLAAVLCLSCVQQSTGSCRAATGNRYTGNGPA